MSSGIGAKHTGNEWSNNSTLSLARDSQRTVFLFDEITHLSRGYQSSLTSTLRTTLDQHSHKLCAFYNGNLSLGSEDAFSKILNHRSNIPRKYTIWWW